MAAMQRQRRSTSDDSFLWENPCDYAASGTSINVPDPKDVAPKLIIQAKSALESTAKYKNTFALLHSYQNFEKLVADWEGNEWLRTFTFPKDILPKEKVLNKKLPDENLNSVIEKIDEYLPSMYNGLQLIVAGLHEFSRKGLNDNIISDENLKKSVNQTMTDVRAVLCYFNSIIKGRKLEIPPLKDAKPFAQGGNMLQDGLLVYRDTLNYLEYLLQVFQKLY